MSLTLRVSGSHLSNHRLTSWLTVSISCTEPVTVLELWLEFPSTKWGMHISAHPVYKMSLFLHISFTEGNFSRALRILAYFLHIFCIFVNTYAYLCIFPNCIFFVHFSTYLYIFVHIYAYIFHVCCILNAYFMHISTYSCILLVCSLHVYWHIYCIFIAYSRICFAYKLI
jgi:hypothetical protein